MSVAVELIRIARGTKFAARVEKFTLRIFGKDVARYTVSDMPGVIERAAERELQKSLELVAAGILEAAEDLYASMLLRYPNLLKGIDKGTFAEIVALAVERGRMSPETLRGLLVEKLCRALPETAELLNVMDKVRKAANAGLSRGKGWGVPRFAYSIVDRQGKQLGDLCIVAQHSDGRIWIMSLIESKSVSNVDDLARLKDLPVGQHLWDFTRAKAGGLVIDGKFYKPSLIEMAPVPVGKWGEAAGVVAKKGAEQRAKEMAGGLYTQFIGFVPREMSANNALRVAADGIQLELWQWPFDLSEFNRFQQELVKALGRTRRLLP